MGTSDVGLSSVKTTANIADASFITISESISTSFAENITNQMPQNTTTPFQHTDDQPLSWLMNVYLVITASIIILGLLGNSFILIIMKREPFRSSSYGIHLTALAVADNLALILYTFTKDSTVYLFEKDIFGESDVVCKIFYYALMSAKLFTSFSISFICIERFVAVWFPFKSKILLSKRAAIIASGCIFVAANFAGIVQFLLAIVKSDTCLPFEETAGATPVSVVMLFMVASILPTIILLTFTPFTIFKLIRQQQLKRQMKNAQESRNGQLAYMTAMLIGTVIAYILLVSFPTFARFLLAYIGISPAIAKRRGMHEIIVTTDHLNCALNFVIYGLLCSEFRKQFIYTCKRFSKMRTDLEI